MFSKYLTTQNYNITLEFYQYNTYVLQLIMIVYINSKKLTPNTIYTQAKLNTINLIAQINTTKIALIKSLKLNKEFLPQAILNKSTQVIKSFKKKKSIKLKRWRNIKNYILRANIKNLKKGVAKYTINALKKYKFKKIINTSWTPHKHVRIYKTSKKNSIKNFKKLYNLYKRSYNPSLVTYKTQKTDEQITLPLKILFWRTLKQKATSKLLNNIRLKISRRKFKFSHSHITNKLINTPIYKTNPCNILVRPKHHENLTDRMVFQPSTIQPTQTINFRFIRNIQTFLTYKKLYTLHKSTKSLQKKYISKNIYNTYNMKKLFFKTMYKHNLLAVCKNITTPILLLNLIPPVARKESHTNKFYNQQTGGLYNAAVTNYFPIKIHTINQFTHTNNLNLGVTNGVKNTLSTYYNTYLLNILEGVLQKKIYTRVYTKSLLNKFWQNYKAHFSKLNGHMYRRFSKIINVHELLEIIILTFKFQDTTILLRFLKTRFESTHFKNHKKILSIFFDVMKKNKALFIITPIRGFSFDIRGKVGVAGNAKKRHVFFSYGKITTTSQNLKANWQQTNVWTPTGQMGITCLLQY